jgi:hypothetical protein
MEMAAKDYFRGILPYWRRDTPTQAAPFEENRLRSLRATSVDHLTQLLKKMDEGVRKQWLQVWEPISPFATAVRGNRGGRVPPNDQATTDAVLALREGLVRIVCDRYRDVFSVCDEVCASAVLLAFLVSVCPTVSFPWCSRGAVKVSSAWSGAFADSTISFFSLSAAFALFGSSFYGCSVTEHVALWVCFVPDLPFPSFADVRVIAYLAPTEVARGRSRTRVKAEALTPSEIHSAWAAAAKQSGDETVPRSSSRSKPKKKEERARRVSKRIRSDNDDDDDDEDDTEDESDSSSKIDVRPCVCLCVLVRSCFSCSVCVVFVSFVSCAWWVVVCVLCGVGSEPCAPVSEDNVFVF